MTAGDSDYPQIADVTARFVYARIMGTNEAEEKGYSGDALDLWTERARIWAGGGIPERLGIVAAQKPDTDGRDVFLYIISGCKARNPAAAMAIIERLA